MATNYQFGTAQVKGRNPFALLGLGIVTLGIYLVYWWYAANREIRDASGGRIQCEPWVSVLAFTLGGLIIVPFFVTIHKGARRAQELGRIAGRSEVLNMWVYWLLYIFGGVAAHIYMQWEMNKIWATMAAGGMQAAAPQQVPVAAAGPGTPDAGGPFIQG